MNYRISYPALSKTKFTTITYLDSTQKVRTAVLTDTSFSLRVSYKSGDSVYVRLNPNLYFLDNKVSKRINYGKSIMGASSICTRQDYINNGNFPVAAGDSLASSAVGQVLGSFGISPRRLD
jgi:hypothetical protein